MYLEREWEKGTLSYSPRFDCQSWPWLVRKSQVDEAITIFKHDLQAERSKV
jgi:hypothetical protein